MTNPEDFVIYEEVDELTKENMRRIFQKEKGKYWKRKRVFDVTVSMLMILLLSPLLLLIYILIFLDDPHGSPIYRQVRVGRHGKEFLMYKFRTMIVNAEQYQKELEKQNEMDGPVFKIKNDPRITRLGRFLRVTSLDELPQFFNVLKGDMSIVGPRPPVPREVEKYDAYEKLRLVVTPGLTCIWQVTHNRNEIPFSRWVEMDLEYIENRTIWLDIKMICRTVVAIFRASGR